MKNQILIFSFLPIFILLSMAFVSPAGINSVAFNTANYSEHDTVTPSISITVVGNSSAYYATFRVQNLTGTVFAESAFQVLNDTATNITLNDINFASNNSYNYNVTVYNDTNNRFDGAGATGNLSNGTSARILYINQQPTISAIVERGDNVVNGLVGFDKDMNWTFTISDTNSTDIDSVRVYVCKTNSFTTSCASGQTWAISALERDGSIIANYTVVASDTAGTKNYYAFAVDDNGYVSAVSSGTFQIVKGGTPLEEIEAGNQPPASSKEKKKISTLGTILIIGGIIAVLWWIISLLTFVNIPFSYFMVELRELKP